MYVNFAVYMKVKQDDTVVDLPLTAIKDVLFEMELEIRYCVSKNDSSRESL